MNDRNRVINEIIKANSDYSNEIIVNTSNIAKLLNKKRQNVYRTVMHLVDDGVLIKQGTNKYKFSNPDKIKFDYSGEVEDSFVTKDITLSCNEAIRIFGYIYHQCNIYNNKYNSTLENIGKENNISDKNKISDILKELQERNLIKWVIGDYHEGKASEFAIITTEQVNEEIDVVDTTTINNNKVIDDTAMEEVIKKQQERITFLEEEVKRLNGRIDKFAKLFKEKVLDKEVNNDVKEVKEIKNVTPIPVKTVTPVTPQCMENNIHQPHVRYKHDDFTRIKIKLFQDRFQIMNADVPKSDVFDFTSLHNIGVNGKDVIINDVVSVLKDNFTRENFIYALKTIAPYCEVYESIVNEIFDMCDTDTEKRQIIVTWFNNILQ